MWHIEVSHHSVSASQLCKNVLPKIAQRLPICVGPVLSGRVTGMLDIHGIPEARTQPCEVVTNFHSVLHRTFLLSDTTAISTLENLCFQNEHRTWMRQGNPAQQNQYYTKHGEMQPTYTQVRCRSYCSRSARFQRPNMND